MSNIKINLMLKEYAPPRQAGVLEWGLVAAAALAVVVGTVHYAGVHADTLRMAARAEDQGQRLHVVKAQLAEAAVIQQRELRVARAEGELKGLEGRRWSGVLLTLRDLTPQDVTWQSLQVSGDEMTLKATSRGLVDVAQLFAGLIARAEVAEVTLHYVNEAGIRVEYKVEGDQPLESTPAATFKQLEFEVVITLAKQEGGGSSGA
ncbi:MAG: hypothetical protein ACOY93_06695 [Bacillota bacterium]